MYKTPFIIAGFFALSIALAKFLDAWIDQSKKEILNKKLEDLWVKIEDSTPLSVAKIPLSILETLYNAIFGEQIFSKKAYMRSSIISAIVLISLLSVSGLYTGIAFSITTPPWKFYDDFSEIALKNILDDEKKTFGKDLTEKQREKFIKGYSFIGSKPWKIGHGIFFVLATLLLNAFFDATSLSTTRLMLREALLTKSAIVAFCILSTNLIIAFLLSTLAIILVAVCYIPLLGGVFGIGASLLVEHTAWTIIGAVVLIVAVWNLSGLWMKIIALTTILPILLLCGSLLFYFLLYPLRFRIQALSSKLLLNALNYKKGIFAFCAILLGLLGSAIGLLAMLIK